MSHPSHSPKRMSGFTLVEMSIVLAIVGLIIGGVLAGMSLVQTARMRSVISQLGTYQAATNTFYNKYGHQLPGDMLQSLARQAGLTRMIAGTVSGINDMTSQPIGGYGDGDGRIQCGLNTVLYFLVCGEETMFWVHLQESGLINDSGLDKTAVGSGSGEPVAHTVTRDKIGKIFPQVKMGRSLYFIPFYSSINPYLPNNKNNFVLVPLKGLNCCVAASHQPAWDPANGLTPYEAYFIDSKLDDGFPNSGHAMGLDDKGSSYNRGYCGELNAGVQSNNYPLKGAGADKPACGMQFNFEML